MSGVSGRNASQTSAAPATSRNCSKHAGSAHLGPHGDARDVHQHGRRLLQRALLHLSWQGAQAGKAMMTSNTKWHAHAWAPLLRISGKARRQPYCCHSALATNTPSSRVSRQNSCPALHFTVPHLLHKLHAAEVEVLAGIRLQHLVRQDGGGLDEGVVHQLRQEGGAKGGRGTAEHSLHASRGAAACRALKTRWSMVEAAGLPTTMHPGAPRKPLPCSSLPGGVCSVLLTCAEPQMKGRNW